MTPPLQYRHAKVQRLRRLLARSAARHAEQVYVVEGPTLLGEALAAGASIEAVFVAPAHHGRGAPPEVAAAWEAGVRVYDLEPGVLERVTSTVTPQPVVSIVAMDATEVADISGPGPVIVCVDVRDPGNLGTVLRSAEAAGAAGVICCDGTVDVYNPKSVRASAGALFHVPVVAGGGPVAVLESLAQGGRHRMGATVRAGVAYTEADLTRPLAIVLGNEANGLPETVAEVLDSSVHIPMDGRSESLNVGMACAVLCFEAARQRRVVAVGR